jgi:hypothetical protein
MSFTEDTRSTQFSGVSYYYRGWHVSVHKKQNTVETMKTSLNGTMMHLLLALIALSITAVVSQEQVCYSGFVMDKFCIDQGFMIDNGLPTLKQPEEHSVHCLVEIASCIDSGYEILTFVNGGDYKRAVSLDATGNELTRKLALEVGSCSTCAKGFSGSQKKGFAATVVGVLDRSYTGTPPRLLVSNVYTSDITCESVLPRTGETCEDKGDFRFFELLKQRDCFWLSKRPFWKDKLCTSGSDIMNNCEETCKKCTDSCDDDNDAPINVKLVNGATKARTCKWLSTRRRLIALNCIAGTEAHSKCQETCHNCNIGTS